jgi:hypothetical protein
MSNLVKFSGANLPSVTSLSTALRSIATDVSAVSTSIIKMDRTGHWVFGADQTEAEDDARWAVNPFSFVHGFIAWGDGEVLAEKLVPVTEPLPELEAAPPGAKKGWEPQTGLSLKCISGEDAGMEARFTTTSVGGRKAVQALAVEIAAQVEKDQSKPVPVVKLGKDHYTHKSYGRIYTPVFEVVEWVSMNGEAAEAAPEAEAAPAAGRRRRSA